MPKRIRPAFHAEEKSKDQLIDKQEDYSDENEVVEVSEKAHYIDKLITKRKQVTQKVTFDVNIDLIRRLKKYQMKYPQGFKKELIDSAISSELDKLDRAEKAKKKTKESGTG